MRACSFCLSVAEATTTALVSVAIMFCVLYVVPVLVVREDVHVVYRHYAPSNYSVSGWDAQTRQKCTHLENEHISTVALPEESLLWDFFYQDAYPKGVYTLWTLVHPTNITDTQEECSRLHWHVAGYVDDEEDAKHWIQQEYSKDCGTFVAHTMSLTTYLCEKLFDRERGPIVATLLDLYTTQ